MAVTTWNQADKDPTTTLSNGNLTITGASGTGLLCKAFATTTKASDTGVFSWEVTVGAIPQGAYLGVGVNGPTRSDRPVPGKTDDLGITWLSHGYNSANAEEEYVPSSVFAENDKLRLDLHTATGQLNCHRNGALVWSAVTKFTSYTPFIGVWNDSSATTNFGAAAFNYSPPSHIMPYNSDTAPKLWTPSELGSRVGVWVKADTLTQVVGAQVLTWPDSGPSSNNAQVESSLSDRPIIGTKLNGKKTVRFPGRAGFNLPNATAAGAASASFLTLYVRDLDPPTDSSQTGGPFTNFGATSEGSHHPWVDGLIYDSFHRPGRASYALPTKATTWGLLGVRSSPTNYSAFQNGSKVAASNADNVGFVAQDSRQPSIGYDRISTVYHVGNIAEGIYVRDYLSADEWARLEGYLAWKWGQQAVLPAGHQYKSSAPTVSVPNSLSPASAASSHPATSPPLASKSALTPGSSSSGHVSTSPALLAKSSVAPATAQHAQASTSPALAAKQSLGPSAAASQQIATSPSMQSRQSLSPVPASQGHVGTEAPLTARGGVSPAAALHAQEASTAPLTAHALLAPADSSHTHTVSATTLAFRQFLTPSGSAHAQVAGSPVLSARSAMLPDSAAQAQASTATSLTAKSYLYPASAFHAHNASPAFFGNAGAFLEPASALHAQSAAPSAFLSRQWVVPSDAVQLSSATPSQLTYNASVSPDSASHQHIAAATIVSITVVVKAAPESVTARLVLISNLATLTLPASTVTYALGTPKMALPWPDKDPDDIIDRGFAITGFEDGDTIAKSEATVAAGTVAIDSHNVVPGQVKTRTRLSGGVDGETAKILIRTTMASGQRVDQTMEMRIAQR